MAKKAEKERVLIIIESPGKQKTILKYLPDDKDYRVLASRGHIVDLSTKGKYNLGVNIEQDFAPHYVLNNDKIDVLGAIIDAAKNSDKILICSDEDREGEFIGYSIAERIKTVQKPIRRIVFNEITEEKIKKALNEEKDIDYNMVQSAIARRVLDRIVGYMVSPFVIKKLGKGLSAGRVQSVALRLVVDREREIEKFEPKEYWNLNVSLNKFANDMKIVAKLNEDISNTVVAKERHKELEKAIYTVVELDSTVYKRKPFPPLTTPNLLGAAAGRYHFPAARTMEAAQTLYQEGKITYMRTDSLRQSNEALSMIRGWIENNCPKCLPAKPILYKNKDTAQNAHEAIRPTHIDDAPKAHPVSDCDKIYKLIWEVSVASQMNPAIYDITNVVIKTDKNRELKTKGKILKDLGWLSLVQDIDGEKEDDSDVKLPPLIVGDILKLVDPGVTSEQKFTQPPSRWSERTLIKELERRGIGRPSTYAEIMRKISSRDYVETKGAIFIPTEKGKDIVDLLAKFFEFMEFDYTAEMETKLDEVAKGKISYVELMKGFFVPFKETLDKAYSENNEATGYVCSKCNEPMVIKKSTFGHFLGCSAYPKCKNTINCEIVNGKLALTKKKEVVAPEDIQCPKCGEPMVVRDGKFGKFYSCSTYPLCNGNKKMPFGKKCPKCGGDLFRTIFGKPPFMGPVLCCTGYPDCKYVEQLSEPGFEKENQERKQRYSKLSREKVGRR